MQLKVLNKFKKISTEDMGKCSRCTALCCKYVAFQLTKPRSAKRFEEYSRYLNYKNANIFIEDGDWYIEFKTPCDHLRGIACGIYLDRPRVCEEHSSDECEFDEEDPDDTPYDARFETQEDLKKEARKKKIKYEIQPPNRKTLIMPMDTPEDIDDYDYIRWYISHKGINAIKKGDDWYIEFVTKPKTKIVKSDKPEKYDDYELKFEDCHEFTKWAEKKHFKKKIVKDRRKKLKKKKK